MAGMAPQPDGIIHKTVWVADRGADVAIVSDELAGQYNRSGSQGPLDQWFGLTIAVPLGRKSGYGLNAEAEDTNSGSL